MRASAALAVLLTLVVATPGVAAPTACPLHHPAGQAPDVAVGELDLQALELCNTAFAVLHSGTRRTPVYAAERLTRETVQAGKGLKRPPASAFHADLRVPATQRAELKDYRRSGYDRGHMAPNADMPSEPAQIESFSLANMVPQNNDNNTKLWRRIEAAVRDFAEQEGEVYVVSGPIHLEAEVTSIGRRVQVPTNLFKAVYSPAQRRAAAYLVRNAPGMAWTPVSLEQLEDMTGLTVFPGLPLDERRAMLDLPDPARQR